MRNGLRHMTMASRAVRDLEREHETQVRLYKQLREHIDTFIDAFDRVQQEKGEANVSALLDRGRLQALTREAEESFSADKPAEANRSLREATGMIESALSDARHKDVLLHELSFDSLQEEYDYELERNRSYLMLIRLLQDKGTVSEASRAYIQKITLQNQAAQQNAGSLAGRGELEAAIRELERSTDRLSRALRMTGASI